MFDNVAGCIRVDPAGGWRDELKEQCKRIVKERGFENITTDNLAQ